MAYRLITQADVDKHPEWASQGKSVNQMHDFPEDEQGNEIETEDEDDGSVKGQKPKPEKPVSQSSRSMREEAEAPEKAEKPEKPAQKAEKPVTKNDAAKKVAPKTKGK